MAVKAQKPGKITAVKKGSKSMPCSNVKIATNASNSTPSDEFFRSDEGDRLTEILVDLKEITFTWDKQKELELKLIDRDSQIEDLRKELDAANRRHQSETEISNVLQRSFDQIQTDMQERERRIRSLVNHCSKPNCRHPDCKFYVRNDPTTSGNFAADFGAAAGAGVDDYVKDEQKAGEMVPSSHISHLKKKMAVLQRQLREAIEVGKLREGYNAADDSFQKTLLGYFDQLKEGEEITAKTVISFIQQRQQLHEVTKKMLQHEREISEIKKKHKENISNMTKVHAEEMLTRQKLFHESVIDMKALIREKASRMEEMELVIFEISNTNDDHKKLLEDKNLDLAKRMQRMSARRKNEFEGHLSDVALLRKRMSALERKIQQMALIERLPDDERLDDLLIKLQLSAPDIDSDTGGGDLRHDLHVIQEGYRRIEERVATAASTIDTHMHESSWEDA